jgi:hypothetical protein
VPFYSSFLGEGKKNIFIKQITEKMVEENAGSPEE